MTPSATALQPLGCTHLKLRRLVRDVARWYDDDLRDLGLKGTQYTVLSQVLRLGPERPGVLARAMGVDASTLTRNLQPMVEAGWVALVPGTDARSRLVRITPAGRALRERAQARWRRSQQRINDTLGIATVIALHALLDECTERVERAQGLRPDDPDRRASPR
jgi:DNA-binding MarR family transcriptional regulator